MQWWWGVHARVRKNNPSPAFIPRIELLCIRVAVVLVPQSVKQLIFSVGKQPIREVKRSRVMTLNCDWPQWIWCAGNGWYNPNQNVK